MALMLTLVGMLLHAMASQCARSTKLHNVPDHVYGAAMISARSRTFLAQLRTSARLGVLVLLVFTFKIGTAAACAKHDFADLMGSGAGQTTEMRTLAGDNQDLAPTQAGHVSTCNHCGCHHPAAVVSHPHLLQASVRSVLLTRIVDLNPSTPPPRELRPPIV